MADMLLKKSSFNVHSSAMDTRACSMYRAYWPSFRTWTRNRAKPSVNAIKDPPIKIGYKHIKKAIKQYLKYKNSSTFYVYRYEDYTDQGHDANNQSTNVSVSTVS